MIILKGVQYSDIYCDLKTFIWKNKQVYLLINYDVKSHINTKNETLSIL